MVYALPCRSPVPGPRECPADEERWLRPPLPPGALPDIRLAFRGNGSAWSYLAASIVARELSEMGSAWHGASWSTHEFIDRDPRLWPEVVDARREVDHTDDKHAGGAPRTDLTWLGHEVSEWRPHVDMIDGEAIVRFITTSRLGLEQFVLHEDRYELGQYVFDTTITELATGDEGYIH